MHVLDSENNALILWNLLMEKAYLNVHDICHTIRQLNEINLYMTLFKQWKKQMIITKESEYK